MDVVVLFSYSYRRKPPFLIKWNAILCARLAVQDNGLFYHENLTGTFRYYSHKLRKLDGLLLRAFKSDEFE